jgi:quinoprotein glucose dehydrogenase
LRLMLRSLSAATFAMLVPALAAAQRWPTYGGEATGERYSAATIITRDNVHLMAQAWTFHTGDQPHASGHGANFEDTPILADGKLLVCTPSDRVIALNPLTGQQDWAFDPKLSASLKPANDFVCRGVAVWHDSSAAPGAVCGARVILATLDARVIELDLATGRPCVEFGDQGTVTLAHESPQHYPGELTLDSPPAVLNDRLIVGSAIDDMTRADTPSAAVRALGARTGALLWQFDPSPAEAGSRLGGGGNVWAPIAVDAPSGMVFLPTASPSAAFFGGERPGEDLSSSAVVALDGGTGKLVWSFQTTHLRRGRAAHARHDPTRWPQSAGGDGRDQDGVRLRARSSDRPPRLPGRGTPGACKGHSGRAGFPYAADSLGSALLGPAAPRSRRCLGSHLRRSTLVPAADRTIALRRALYAAEPTRHYHFPLQWRWRELGRRRLRPGGWTVHRQRHEPCPRGAPGSPCRLCRRPCRRTEGGDRTWPWHALRCRADAAHLDLWHSLQRAALGHTHGRDLASGAFRWQIPLGSMATGFIRGLPNLGGPIVTASGLVFIAASRDDKLRAFDVSTGKELWQASLPAGGQATPMSYVAAGRQFVLIAAGGHSRLGSKLGDAVIAFSLPPGTGSSTIH